MAYRDATGSGYNDQQGTSAFRGEGREPGTRRKKLAGYLKAANELRQSYSQNWNSREGPEESEYDLPGAFPDAAVVRHGGDEMILFPSYARKHIKSKPQAVPGTIQEVGGTGRDVRDTTGAGDAEFWQRQWDKYEDDNAIVDVDVRGWIYSPHKGQLSRKHRLMVGLARQLVGIPAPNTKGSPSTSQPNSRSSSPVRHGHRERVEARQQRSEDELVAQQAEEIVKKGETEAEIAGRGGFSERPGRGSDANSIFSTQSRSNSPAPSSRHGSMVESLQNENSDYISPIQKRSSWPAPSKMSPAELAVANNNLMARLKPFMANPLANTAISAFFYNETQSRQRTINTNPSGHFSLRAALDFVPTHVRILASEKLSATEEVNIMEPRGVSLISDIDDTIKHSAITSGAREIFRNAFIRDLADLSIEGVKEWYNQLAGMGVSFHYVSNSPYQLYPVLTSFFSLAGLPKGTFHLKQYTGMLQGIFEPVAERKKSSLDKLLRDFPERKFILVGDSGEADLEVYTDVVQDNPGRILAIFIRDVTTPSVKGFFDSSMGSLSGERGGKYPKQNKSTDSLSSAKRFNRPDDVQDEDAELRAAIAASLKDMENQAVNDRKARSSGQRSTTSSDLREHRPNLPPRRATEQPAPEAHQVEDLISFSDDEGTSPASSAPTSQIRRGASFSEGAGPSASPPPRPPIKPDSLRSPSSEVPNSVHSSTPMPGAKAPPPKPRKPSTTVVPSNPSPLSQVQITSPAVEQRPPLPNRQSYRTAAKHKLSAAYNALPAVRSTTGQTSTQSTGGRDTKPVAVEDPSWSMSPRSLTTQSTRSLDETKSAAPLNANAVAVDGQSNGVSAGDPSARKLAPPPPPPRRNLSSYPAAAAHYASNRLSWGSSEKDGNNTNTGNGYNLASGNPQAAAPVNKKLELWKRRWARAGAVMEREGVLLRTWHVGEDVSDECIRLVQNAMEDMERNGERREIEARRRQEGKEHIESVDQVPGRSNHTGNMKGRLKR